MNAALFNAVHTPLSVKFCCHIVAEIPAAIVATMMETARQNPNDGLAIALEYCLKRRFFVQLLNQEQLLEEFDCTQEHYDSQLLPPCVIKSASEFKASTPSAN